MDQDNKPRVQGTRKDDPIRGDGLATDVGYRFDLLPPESLMAAAQVMHEGAVKGYKPEGWRKVELDDQLNHAMGHLNMVMMEELTMRDDEDGEDHLAHAMVRLMMAWAVRNSADGTRKSRV